MRHTLSGTISESGAGPIGDVSVSAGEGKLSVTDERGQYQIQGLSGRVNVTLEKPGFERMVVFGTTMAHDLTLDAAIQRAIHITPGERANVTIFGDDGDYDFAYTGCSAPCKMIRLAIDTPGVLSVGVRALDESRVVYLLIERSRGLLARGVRCGQGHPNDSPGRRRDEALRRLRGWLSRGRESDPGDFDDVRQAPMTSMRRTRFKCRSL